MFTFSMFFGKKMMVNKTYLHVYKIYDIIAQAKKGVFV